jgi:hypothetical protein
LETAYWGEKIVKSDNFDFTPLNLALSGNVEDFLELYINTENTYMQVVDEHPSFLLTLPSGRDHVNRIAKSRILSDFNHVLGRCLEIFGVNDCVISIQERHLKYFDFFDAERIRNIDVEIRINQEWAKKGYTWVDKKYLSDADELYTIQSTMIGFEAFLNYFRRAVMRCICEERQKSNPAYTIFQARKDVESSISIYMKRMRYESIVPLGEKLELTEEPLYLYDALSGISCKRCEHRIVPAKYYTRHVDGKNAIVLPVHFCEHCSKYMCGKISYSLFQSHFGRVRIIAKELADESKCWNIHGESMLHQLGYTVEEGKLSSSERQNLLVTILESKQLTFFEIVATIEQDIRIFETNFKMKSAVRKWKEDLRFINEYVTGKL